MSPKRSYGDGCAVAAALDAVGERWALLIVRELLLGPKRFVDVQAGLHGASPNVLAQRLRELEEAQVIRRRRLGPPARAWVYELTEWGLDLEPVVAGLGRWGRRSPFLDRDAPTSVDSLVLGLRAFFDPVRTGDVSGVCTLWIDDDRFVLRLTDGRLEISRGEATAAQAGVETDAETFAALLARTQELDEAVSEGRARLTGDTRMFERLLDGMPGSGDARGDRAAACPV